MSRPRFSQSDESALRALLDSLPMTRRGFVRGAAGGLGAGACLELLRESGLAAPRDEDHFFLFVELRGGVHWMLATDGRDPAQLPLDDPRVVFPLRLTKDVPADLRSLLSFEGFPGLEPAESPPDVGDAPSAPPAPISDVAPPAAAPEVASGPKPSGEALNVINGRFICLPYPEEAGNDVRAALAASYRKGTTALGASYVLGFAGEPLRPYIDELAVVRGVHQTANFHGRANVEAFSCDPDSKYPHVAAVIAKGLEASGGELPLDNLVFENATFADSTTTAGAAPVRLTAATLGAIARGAIAAGSVDLLSPARAVADAIRRRTDISASYKSMLEQYAKAISGSPSVKQKLTIIKDQLGVQDASLDLLGQLKTATAMFGAGLSRVATVCYGAQTDNNKVDSFGVFDAHRGMYHSLGAAEVEKTSFLHHKKVEKACQDLAAFFDYLKRTNYTGTKKLSEVVTVVVSSEFGRPSNFFGNEGGGEQPGCGHYWFNNNYLLFGKGVRGGAWIGNGDPIRQMGHLVDMTTLGGPLGNIKTQAIAFQNDGASTEPVSFSRTGDLRPLQPRDVIKTVLSIARLDSTFDTFYPDSGFAKTCILPLGT